MFFDFLKKSKESTNENAKSFKSTTNGKIDIEISKGILQNILSNANVSFENATVVDDSNSFEEDAEIENNTNSNANETVENINNQKKDSSIENLNTLNFSVENEKDKSVNEKSEVEDDPSSTTSDPTEHYENSKEQHLNSDDYKLNHDFDPGAEVGTYSQTIRDELRNKSGQQYLNLRDTLLQTLKTLFVIQLVSMNIVIIMIVVWIVFDFPIFNNINTEIVNAIFGFFKYYITAILVEILAGIIYIVRKVFSVKIRDL